MHDFSQYRLLEELPSESCGSVYRMAVRTTGMEVKIYFWELPPARWRTPREVDFAERFLRETTQASRLSHPGIARIFDSGASEGKFYLATEIIEGASLQLKKETPLSTAFSLELLRQAAAALDYAHAMGVLHLALEPDRMVVNAAARLRLTGFGEGAITAFINSTMPELMAPNLSYMAPEQLMNQECDAMADQFSLTAIAFQMLTGQSPFHAADSMSSELTRILPGEHPVADKVNPDLAPEVSETLRRGLARDPGERFKNCGELVSAIEVAFREKTS
jgi:serine/threonine protein kinase